jgi:hypothetical protein
MAGNVHKPKPRRLARGRQSDDLEVVSHELARSGAPREESGLEAEAIESPGLQSLAGGLEARKLDPSLGVKIRLSLQEKAGKLLEQAKRDPKSEASLMVYVLLLNELATMEGRLSPERLKGFDEERRRWGLIKTVEHQRNLLQVQKQKLLQATLKLNQHTAKMNRARDLATVTGHQLDAGKEVDMRGVCRRIAEIVGLRPPPQFGTAAPGPGENMEPGTGSGTRD